MKTNVAGWLALHEAGYYKLHPYYKDKTKAPDGDLLAIRHFLELRPEWTVAIIGSGYGREAVLIAPLVRKVYGVDVGEIVFAQMREYLAAKKVSNVEAVDASRWREELPAGLDFVYSFVTFQHLTRDLTRDYILGLAEKFAEDGRGVVQFSDSPTGSVDTEDIAVEPNVRWTVSEIKALFEEAGLTIYRLETRNGVGGIRSKKPWVWHWVYFGKRRRG
jgi:cyclopropane fatty-acyl-phospholipid synthase-like methyltransferase